jgi:protease-4
MFRYQFLIALSVAMALATFGMTGCRSRPLMTVMNGNMNVNGKMDMVGDMNMRGDMKMAGEVTTVMKSDNTASRLSSVPVYATTQTPVGKKICIIDVDGLMINRNMSGFGSMGENPVALFREKLDFVATDPSMAALVLRINSCGGGVTAADIMSRDLQRTIAARRIPVVACVMEVGTGAAYYLACGADRILVHPTSIVGGIGVIMNAYNLEDMMGQFGIVPIPIKQGPMIDMGTPGRVMEESERQALQAIADQFHNRFVQRVKASRKSIQVSEAVFDGRVFTGQTALEAGLVDQVGYLDDAIAWAGNLAGLDHEPTIVMLRRERDRAYSVLDVTPNSPTLQSIIPIKVPGLDRSSLPTFLYLWQPEPQPL